MITDIPVKERILFQNEACLVINKLPGESSESPETDEAGGEYCVPVHRLDTPVSGCLLLARRREAAAFFGATFAQPAESGLSGAVEKKYWTIVEMPKEEFPAEGELVHWLFENRELNKSFAVPWKEGEVPHKEKYAPPKKAVLRYRVIGKGERYLFLEVDLVTGRHHQIRAQLAALGLHIKGDLKYGAKRSEKGGGIRLHAWSLAFPNPLNPGELIRVNAEPPLHDALWQAFAYAHNAAVGTASMFSSKGMVLSPE